MTNKNGHTTLNNVLDHTAIRLLANLGLLLGSGLGLGTTNN